MAWVHLSNMLEDDKNLHGLIPADTPCIVRLTSEGAEFIKKNAIKKLMEAIEKMGDQATIAKFLQECPDWNEPEWAFGKNGCFINWDGPYKVEGRFRTLNFLELDVSEWLKKQDDEFLIRLGVLAFNHWKRDDGGKTTKEEDLITKELLGDNIADANFLINNRQRDRKCERKLFSHLGRKYPR